MATKITSVCDGVHLSPLMPLVLMLSVLCETVIVLVHATRMNMSAHSFLDFLGLFWLESKSGLYAKNLKPIVCFHTV